MEENKTICERCGDKVSLDKQMCTMCDVIVNEYGEFATRSITRAGKGVVDGFSLNVEIEKEK